MAAGQQKKRLISSSLHEHYRGKKKKKINQSDFVLNLRSQIYLEWDDSQKKTMAKREQIGLTWAHMAPFIDSAPHHSGLADVLCVPRETYSLNNLMEVLSYEVWATSLSESERKLLTQFLPSGTGAEHAVQSLLSGENHHFGNPLLRWSTLLCSGNLHPDGILQRERRIRSNKKQYYLKLNKYHTDMLKDLQKWKDKWIHCDDPEQLWRKVLTKPNERTSPISSGKAIDMPQKFYIRNDDAAKYMSFIKINKKQLEAIKNIKHSGDGIQSKILSRVLCDINSFHIHPYEALEKEERTRIHEHWLQIVNRDLPMAFEAWKEKRSHMEQLKKHLEQELSEKRKRTLIIHKIEAENPEISREEKREDDESEQSTVDKLVQQDIVSASISLDTGNQLEHGPSLNSHLELRPKALEEAVGQDILIFGDNHTVPSQLKGKEDLVDVDEPNTSSSPVKCMWQAVDATRYNSSGDFSQRKPEPLEECHVSPISDLERDIEQECRVSPISDLERDIEQECREPDDASLFSLYGGRRQNTLLPSFTKDPEFFSYDSSNHLNELKQPELQFLMENGGLSETLQFPNPVQEQQNLIEQNHARERDQLYMRHMMNKSIYSNRRHPSPELYSSSKGDLVERSWFPDENLADNNYWSTMEPSSSGPHCLGDGGTSDGSLFSVLSACRNKPSQSQQNPTNTEQSMESRNIVHINDGLYGYNSHQFKSPSNHEAAAASTAALRDPWMNNQPHQNPSLPDSIGKPFVRSWNQ